MCSMTYYPFKTALHDFICKLVFSSPKSEGYTDESETGLQKTVPLGIPKADQESIYKKEILQVFEMRDNFDICGLHVGRRCL